MIVLDEPTNDLDLASLRMLEEALADFDGTVLVVSHDRYFLDRICDQIVAFENGGVFVQPGNFSYYLEKKQERDRHTKAAAQAFAPVSAKPALPAKQVETPRRLSYKEQQELDNMESVILANEKKLVDLEKTLSDPAFFATRAAEGRAFIAEIDATKAEVERLYARWEELAG